MTDLAFLAHIPDPFHVGGSRFRLRDKHGNDHSLTAVELGGWVGPTMTIELPAFVDDLRRHGQPPPNSILDLGEALRLAVGMSKDDGGERHWNIWRALSKRFQSNGDARRFCDLALSREAVATSEDVSDLLQAALDAMQMLWADVQTRLQRCDELERLVNVEWPLQSLFANRQFQGIKVQSELVEGFLENIREEKYRAFRTVAEYLKISPSGLNFWNIGNHLRNTELEMLMEEADGSRMREAFRFSETKSQLASTFLTLDRAKRNETIVRRVIGSEERLYPIFSTFGTVTGRILVSDPYLQNLSRRYRGLIAAESGMTLSYLDFAQFEPGVLAALCEDQNLMADYNNSDLYCALAERIFRDEASRPIAKRVFLAFSYGMSAERIALFLDSSSDNPLGASSVASGIKSFFEQYPALEAFRMSQQTRLKSKGYVSSLFGNRRMRNSANELSAKEKRWALNHPVQSTASLIFKECLIALAKEFGRNAIVLPVHDAVLMQFDEDSNYRGKVEGAQQIMADQFRKRFPKIEATVTAGAFAD